MIFCVGLTGPIASGKSTVANFFSQLGVSIINADQIAKNLSLKDNAGYIPIIKRFGETILDANLEIDRKALRKIVFFNPNERLWLESLLHPLIRSEILEQVQNARGYYSMIEIPLLTDKNNYPYLDRILLVNLPQHLQTKRIMFRDHCEQKEAMAIINSQPSIEERRKYADDELQNNSDLESLQRQINQLHEKYLTYAKEKSHLL